MMGFTTARTNRDLIAVLLIVAVSSLVFARDLFVDNSVVFHDEYVYKVSADQQLDQSLVISRGLAPRVPNRLFLGVYGIGSYFGSNYYAFAQFLNVAFWALGLFFLFRLALASGLSDTRALLYLGAAALLPLSAYTKYFMPEAMFFSLFCASVYALMVGLRQEKDGPFVVAGLLVGVLYFVKPHALALLVANVAFLMLHPLRARLNTLFVGGALAAMGVGKLMVAPVPAGTSSLGVYSQVIENQLNTFATNPGLGKVFAQVAAGHALFVACVFGLVVVTVIVSLVPQLRLNEGGAGFTPVRMLSAYLVATGIVLVGMSVVFTSLAGEAGRLHSRYYFFLYPIALLVLFHFEELRLTRAGRFLGLLSVIVGPTLMFLFGSHYSPVLPISLVSDCPEWGFVYAAAPWYYLSLTALVGFGAWAVFRPRMTRWLIAVISVISVVSGAYVAGQQKGIFRNIFATGQEAVAVEEEVGRDHLGTTIVVSESRDVVSKFLFFLPATPVTEQLPAGTNLDTLVAKYPEATHVVALAADYVTPEPLRCSAKVSSVTICRITR